MYFRIFCHALNTPNVSKFGDVKEKFFTTPKLVAKLLSAESFLFLVVRSLAMAKLWKVETKKLSTLQTLTLKFRAPNFFSLSFPKLEFEL